MNLQKLQQPRIEAFKAQDYDEGDFDVIFVIGGKTIYAHKNMVRQNSTTFKSMLSERWTSKDEPIPIETYCYDDFFEFLTFLYSGECKLTNSNIASMTDIAEFYQVAVFKDYCDEYLSKVEFTLHNVFQLLDIGTRYSLNILKTSLIPFVTSKFSALCESDEFLQIRKEVLLEIYDMTKSTVKADVIFEEIYEWAKNQAMSMKESNPNVNLDEAVRGILADVMPLFDFGKMDLCLVIRLIVGKSLMPTGSELQAILFDSWAHTFTIIKENQENSRVENPGSVGQYQGNGRGSLWGSRGSFNQGTESTRGAIGSTRGNVNQGFSAFGGSRGNFGQDQGFSAGRGAFVSARGNFHQGAESTRGAIAGSRGNFRQDQGFASGRGAFGGYRGNFNEGSNAGRGAIGGTRGNFHQGAESTRGAIGGTRGNFGQDQGSNAGRGALVGSRGNFNQGAESTRGNFGQDQGNGDDDFWWMKSS